MLALVVPRVAAGRLGSLLSLSLRGRSGFPAVLTASFLSRTVWLHGCLVVCVAVLFPMGCLATRQPAFSVGQSGYTAVCFAGGLSSAPVGVTTAFYLFPALVGRAA